MELLKSAMLPFITLLVVSACAKKEQPKTTFKSGDMIIRISEIEIDSSYLEAYLSILKEEAEASVRLEPGVISIYPMFQKEKANEIRILEIYNDRAAYESHLLTPHFKHYKTTTSGMVKSLKLIDMKAIDEGTMPQIFDKIPER